MYERIAEHKTGWLIRGSLERNMWRRRDELETRAHRKCTRSGIFSFVTGRSEIPVGSLAARRAVKGRAIHRSEPAADPRRTRTQASAGRCTRGSVKSAYLLHPRSLPSPSPFLPFSFRYYPIPARPVKTKRKKISLLNF